MRNDRLAAHEQHGLPIEQALALEFDRGLASLASPGFVDGVSRFVAGQGRHGGKAGAS